LGGLMFFYCIIPIIPAIIGLLAFARVFDWLRK
jgi:hypothetical protein